jgi:class 3 adenylate cyclase/tetratricopeptide (TPR) repeat protein
LAAKFCPACAYPVATATATPETPGYLAERVLASRAALEGERKYITVLFADLKGSLELLADLDAEDARRLLDAVLHRMIEAVHRYDGIVNQVLGDGIMALFGAPLALEDHAVRACFAALAMRQSLRVYAGAPESHGMDLRVRIGLNSGEVVVRSISSDLRMDYSAVGQTTHLAARMEQMAPPDAIFMTRSVLRLVEGFVEVQPVGNLVVKGLKQPVDVYELTGAGHGGTRLQAAAARGLTPFIGREADLEKIAQAQAAAMQGRGQVVALVGEPGVGKSRLVWEATASSRVRGWLLLETSSLAYTKTTPYRVVVEWLKGYLQIEPDDGHHKIAEKLEGKLAGRGSGLLELLPAFQSLLDIPVVDEGWHALEAALRRQRILEALRRLLLRESQIQPLFLVIEDLHWIDSESQAFVDSFVEGLAAARTFFLVTYRPEYRHDWSHHTYFTRLPISTLPTSGTDQLAGTLLGHAAEVEPIRRRLVHLTEGNPLFLEECVRTLVETGLLVGQRGAYIAAGEVTDVEIPPTVQAVLSARIDRLPPEDKSLLQIAAVIGKDVPFPLLRAIADENEETLRARLSRLRAAELLYEAQLFPVLEYTFKHGLTHDVAYASLLQEHRRALHARILAVIESAYADRLAEHTERLADHATAAGAWDKAVEYHRRAAERAMARSAHREAAQRFERALDAIAHLPETHENLEKSADLRIDARKALFPLGQYARSLERLREAEVVAQKLGDPQRLGRIAVAMMPSFWWMGRYDRSLEAGTRAQSAAEAAGDVAMQIEITFRIAQSHQGLGDYRKAIQFYQRSLDAIGPARRLDRFGLAILPSIFCESYLIWCLAELGEFKAGAARSVGVIAAAREANHPYSLIAACCCAGRHDLIKGELPGAIRRLEEAVELIRLHEIPVWFPNATSALGYAYFLVGRHAEGLSLLEQAIERAGMMAQTFAHALRLVFLADALLELGRRDTAQERAMQALDVARTHQETGSVAYALRTLGAVYADHDSERARACFEESAQIAKRLGMRPILAHCHLGLGELFKRRGEFVDASENIRTAAALYGDLDMGSWRQRAESALSSLDHP